MLLDPRVWIWHQPCGENGRNRISDSCPNFGSLFGKFEKWGGCLRGLDTSHHVQGGPRTTALNGILSKFFLMPQNWIHLHHWACSDEEHMSNQGLQKLVFWRYRVDPYPSGFFIVNSHQSRQVNTDRMMPMPVSMWLRFRIQARWHLRSDG